MEGFTMADRYIDYLEVGEYGDHFVSESKKLDNLSPLVDVPALRAKVQAAVTAVDDELAKVGIKRGDLRGGRDSTAAATAAGKDLIQRFYYALRALPKAAGVDAEAFFPGGALGEVTHAKPADVNARLGALLKGFDTAANTAAASALGAWRADITAGRDTLSVALTGKGGAQGTSITSTAALVAARESFLRVYNKVAKKVVSGLLAELGREAEYELFFKDLTVNEGPKATKKGEDAPAPAPAPAPQPDNG
jgi:hypothetical protein